MAEFTAKDVKALRQATGAGMMDAKQALAGERRRLRGRRAVAAREGPGQGRRALRPREHPGRGRRRPSTATSPRSSSSSARPTSSPSPTSFIDLVQDLADAVAAKGEDAVDEHKAAIDDLKVTLKENIELGEVVRFEAADGNVLDTYLHVQDGRGVNAVSSSSTGGTPGAGPRHRAAHRLRQARRTSPATRCPAERRRASASTLEAETRNEGKPEQAIDEDRRGPAQRLVQASRVLLDQPFVRDEKQTVAADCSATPTIVRFAQVVIGA